MVVERQAPVERSYGVKRVSAPRTVTRSVSMPQLLGGDLRERRARPLAHLRRADEDDDPAVGLEAADRARDGMRSGREQPHRDAAADERRPRLVPADRRGDLLDVADEVRVERLAAGADLFARQAEVLAPHVERVEPAAAGDLVDLRLADPLHVRRAERAVRAGRREVRVDARRVDAVGGPSGTGRAPRRPPSRPRVARCRRRRRCRTARRPRVPSNRPSLVAAVRIRQRMLCRRVVTIDSPTLFWIFTGRPALRASATVSGSIFVYDLEPKPPPRYGT